MTRDRAEAQDGESGFTLIELLVVVLIIGILAAIAIPVYAGVQSSAEDATAESDLGNLKTAVVTVQMNGGTVSSSKATWTASGTSLTADLSKAGATQGDDTTSLSYYPSATGYCLLAISAGGSSFASTDSQGAKKGSCTTSGAYQKAAVTQAP